MKTILLVTILFYSCIEAPCPKKECADFLSWQEAQARYESCPESYENLFQNPSDSVVCQSWLIDRSRR